MKTNINTVQYWNDRFENDNWGVYGEEQSVFFTKIAINAFPEWLKNNLGTFNYTIFDYGCALGNGTAVFSERFPNCRVVGLDFSENAIEQASAKHSNCEFECVNIVTDELKPADVVFSSNTLEHIDYPKKMLEKIVASAKKYAIIMLPFEDTSGLEEHVNIFNIRSFPNTINGIAKLCFFKVIDCRILDNTYWDGKQILVVYSCDESDLHMLNAEDIYEYQIKPLIEQQYTLIEQQNRLIEQQNMYNTEIEQQISRWKEDLVNYETETEKSLQIIKEGVEKSYSIKARVASIGGSKPYKMAHIMSEGKHLLFGTKQDRKAIKKWLFKDRSVQTGYNYIKELYDAIEEISFDMQRVESLEADAKKEAERKICEISLLQDRKSDEKAIRKLLEKSVEKKMFIMPSLIDWNVPLFQRPQQMAIALGQVGIPVVYYTWNIKDQLSNPIEVRENCLLIKAETVDIVFEKIEMALELAREYGCEPILDFYSTGNMYDISFIEKLDRDNNYFKLLYEYIDEISEDISGQEIPESLFELHKSLICNNSVYVVATAEKLYQEVLSIRGNDESTLCSGNGVDIAHFQVSSTQSSSLPKHLEWIKKEERPIIGYFGAIAKWFDFDLVMEASKLRPDYVFLLIGPEYCEGLDRMKDIHNKSNIHYIGVLPYDTLPHVACFFTVATIPFLINDITESTSPLKLFEYMAMGKPVVTTPMRECLKIPEVFIASTPKEYVSCIDEAISIVKGPKRLEYEERMKRLAEDYSWKKKAEEILDLISPDNYYSI